MLRPLRRYLRPMAGAAGAGMTVAALQMLMVVLAARMLGVGQYGVFALALGLANLLAELGTLGLPVLANRVLARYDAQARRARIAAFIAQGDRVFARIAVLLVAGLSVSALATDHLSRTLQGDALADGVLIAALFLPGVLFRLARRHQLSGLGRPALAAVVETGLAATAGIAAVLAGGGLVALALAYAAGSLAGVALAGRIITQHVGAEAMQVSRAKPDPRLSRAWRRAALPMWLAAGGTALFGRVDLVMLGPLTDTVQVGLYAAAVRLTYLIGVVAQIGLPIFWPLIARETARAPETNGATSATPARKADLLYLTTTGTIAAIGGAVLWAASTPVTLLIFGPDYADAAPILRILCVAQVSATLVTALTGTLLMRGQGRRYAPVMLGGLGLAITLNLLLIPYWGALGAAWATLATSLAMLVALTLKVSLHSPPRSQERP